MNNLAHEPQKDAVRESASRRPIGLVGVLLLVALLYALPFYVWFKVSGTYHWVQDTIAIGVGTSLVVGVCLVVRRSSRSFRWPRVSVLLTVLFVIPWSMLSIADAVSDRITGPLPLEPRRFDAVTDRYGDYRIGLALSGGGYRAALVHAGTLQALEDRGIYVDNISTVSGGSIIGTYYALGGSPAAFRDAVGSARFNIKRELLKIETLFGLICPQRLWSGDAKCIDRLRIQEALLDERLFQGAGFNALETDQPRLIINATDLRSGAKVGFSSEFVLINPIDGRPHLYQVGTRARVPDDFTLARAVSISGAFPGAFPSATVPVEISLGNYQLRIIAALTEAHQLPSDKLLQPALLILVLADGGIRDNLGVDQLRTAALSSYSPDAPIVNFAPPGQPPDYTRFGAGRWWYDNGLAAGPDWSVQTALVSNGGAELEGWRSGSNLQQFVRAMELATYTDVNEALEYRFVPRTAFSVESLGWFSPETEIVEEHPLGDVVSELIGGDSASEYVWQYIRRDSLAERAALLPEEYNGAALLQAFEAHNYDEQTLAQIGLMPIVPASFIGSPKPVRHGIDDPPLFTTLDLEFLKQISAVPEWDRTVDVLWEWIEDGNCSSTDDWETYFGERVGDCDSLALATALSRDWEYVTRVFKDSSTLKDVYTLGEARALYRLGQYRVLQTARTFDVYWKHLEQ